MSFQSQFAPRCFAHVAFACSNGALNLAHRSGSVGAQTCAQFKRISTGVSHREFVGSAVCRRRVRLGLRARRAAKVSCMSAEGGRDGAVDTAVPEEIDPGAVEGTSLRVLKYPHPLLREKNETISAEELDPEIKRIAKEMLLVMYASNGVGLAAPQVGVNKRLMVFNPEGDSKAWVQEVVLVNPTIVASSKSKDVEMEGCLSFPGMSGKVKRPEWVKVEATRLNGKKFKVKYEGWKARIFQHEYDHLDGVLYVDRLDDEERAKVNERLEELVAAYKDSPYEGKGPAL